MEISKKMAPLFWSTRVRFLSLLRTFSDSIVYKTDVPVSTIQATTKVADLLMPNGNVAYG